MKIFVPGRICLFGEHSDWAGGYRRINAEIEKGYTLICGTDQGIHADVSSHPTSLILSTVMPDGQRVGPYEIPMEPKALLEEAGKGTFWSYASGVEYQVAINYRVRGLVIHNYQVDLPIKKGLSSSAAICVLTARAFNRVYDLKMTVRGEMELAYLSSSRAIARYLLSWHLFVPGLIVIAVDRPGPIASLAALALSFVLLLLPSLWDPNDAGSTTGGRARAC